MEEQERDEGREQGGEGGRPDETPQRGPGDGPQQPGGFGRDAGRRRRGRRGRGGRPPMPGQGFRPPGQGFQPQGQGFRPPSQGSRPAGPPEHEDEGSAQSRELAAYERRQAQQQQRQQWRGPGFRPAPTGAGGFRGGPRPGFRPGGPPRMGGAPRGPRAGMGRGQRYQEIVRRATGGPRVQGIAPQDAGEPISGPHAVLEALRAGRVLRRIFIAQERGVRSGAVNDLVREAGEKHIQFLFVDRKEVDRLSPTVDHQGVVAIAEGRAGVELDELLLHLDTVTEPALVLVIDSLQDPQNFGVLLRSAEGAGVEGVVIPRHRQVGLTAAVARTSAGASEHLLIADVANLRQAIDALKEKGLWVVATDDSGDMEWDEVDYRGPTAIVVGNEAEGIRRLVLEGCDQVVRVPMQGQVSSLNAAAAGTVVLFEALRQRLRDVPPPQNVKRQERPAPEAAEEAEPEQGDGEMVEDEDLFLEDESGAVEMGTTEDEVAAVAETTEEPPVAEAPPAAEEPIEEEAKPAPKKRTTRKKAAD